MPDFRYEFSLIRRNGLPITGLGYEMLVTQHGLSFTLGRIARGSFG